MNRRRENRIFNGIPYDGGRGFVRGAATNGRNDRRGSAPYGGARVGAMRHRRRDLIAIGMRRRMLLWYSFIRCLLSGVLI